MSGIAVLLRILVLLHGGMFLLNASPPQRTRGKCTETRKTLLSVSVFAAMQSSKKVLFNKTCKTIEMPTDMQLGNVHGVACQPLSITSAEFLQLGIFFWHPVRHTLALVHTLRPSTSPLSLSLSHSLSLSAESALLPHVVLIFSSHFSSKNSLDEPVTLGWISGCRVSSGAC